MSLDARAWLAVALIAALGFASAHRPAAAKVFGAESFTLANGLTVVVVPNARAPVIKHMIWYRVGGADEGEGESGIAHFLEHLMFRGTDKVPPGEFSKIVARNGGQDNAFTARDYTAYFQSVSVDRLPLVMELEADRMRGLKLTAPIVDTERKVILEERRSRTDNNPGSLLFEQVQLALYGSHPYGIPVIGWAQEISALSREDALAYYKRFYAPNNAIVVVAGDVTGAQVQQLVEKFYGPLAPSPDIPPRIRPTVPPQIAPRRVVLTDARAELPSLTRYYLVPSYATAPKNDAEALEILAEVLGGSATSRLYRSLVVEKGLAASAGAWYSGSGLNDTSFGVSATPREGVSLDTLEKAVDEVVAAMVAGGVNAEETKRAKTGLVANAIYTRDSQHAMAQLFGEALTTGETVEDVVKWPKRIEAVKDREVDDVAKRFLLPARSVTGLLLPVKGAKAGARPAPPPKPEEPLH